MTADGGDGGAAWHAPGSGTTALPPPLTEQPAIPSSSPAAPRTLPPPPPAAAAPKGTPPTPLPAARFESVGRLARAVLWAFTAWSFAIGFALASSVAQLRITQRLTDNPGDVTFAQLEATDNRQLASTAIELLMMVVVGIVFIAWMRRLYLNLASLGRPGRYRDGWTIGAWLVPFVSLWRPRQMANEIWAASRHRSPVSSWRTATPDGTAVLTWWWVMWVLSTAFDRLAFRPPTFGDLDGALSVAWGMVIGNVFTAAAGALAIAVVVTMTARQEAHAGAIVDGSGDDRVAPNHPWLRTFAPPAAAFGLGVALVIALVAADDSAGADASGVGILLADLERGVCFDIADSAPNGELFVLTQVEPIPCTAPHALEMVGAVPHPAPADSPFPGDAELLTESLALCLEPFERHVGGPWADSGLDVFTVQPLEHQWRSGQRRVLCAAAHLDGTPIAIPVEGVGSILEPSTRSWFNLHVGDCFDDPPGTTLVIELVPCSQPHDYEVFARVDQAEPGGPFPGGTVVLDHATEACGAAFADAVAPTETALGVSPWLVPHELTWAIGETTSPCVLWADGPTPLDHSVVAG